MTTAKKITAKFESKCTRCAQVVPAGAQCLWAPGTKGVAHVTCPVVLDAELELTDAALTARLEALGAYRATIEAVLADHLLEVVGAEPAKPCAICKGDGVAVENLNVSDTMDCSDWRAYPHPCGTKLNLHWEGRDVAAVLVDGVPASFVAHDGATDRWAGSYVTAGQATRNAGCVAGLRAHNEWRWATDDAAHRFDLAHPELGGVLDLERWARQDLQVRRGDLEASVVNRGKVRVGRVTFIGTSDYSNEERVTVVDADGKKWGGPVETARMVRRIAHFSGAKS